MTQARTSFRFSPNLHAAYLRPEVPEGGYPSILGVTSFERDKETYPVQRPVGSITRLTAMALLVGVAVVGCARHDGGATNEPTSSTPAGQTEAAATQAPTPAPTTADATPAATDATPSTGSASAPAATTDPLDTLLSNTDGLLNGVDSSLSGSDANASAGE